MINEKHTEHVKIFEVRDRMTFIPVLAFRINENQGQIPAYLIKRAGFQKENLPVTYMMRLADRTIQEWPSAWRARTCTTAHSFIRDNWDDLLTGSIIDVEYILGEKDQPKESEFYETMTGLN